MAVYLNESQAGCDNALVGFPHLLVCMGVVLETGAWLYGFHFDVPGESQAQAAAFAAFIADRGGTVANGVRLYGCANWSSRYGGGGKDAWRTEMRNIATVLGYHGQVSGFNTAIINPQDGTYVEYLPDYAQQRCRIYYKRNEKMDYTTTAVANLPNRNIAGYRMNANGQMVPRTGYVTYTSDAQIQATQSNHGQLHELNYFLRLTS